MVQALTAPAVLAVPPLPRAGLVAPVDHATRARIPDATGFAEVDGVRVTWDRYGAETPAPGTPTILLTPTWSIVHARFWKSQIPYLARHFRVVTWDGRGNGRSDRPDADAAYSDEAFARDGVAVLDATGTSRAVLVGLSAGARWSLLMAGDIPDRVAGAVFVAPSLPIRIPRGSRTEPSPFDVERDAYEGWERYNRHFWRRDYAAFLEFFFGRCLTEPHSTKPIEDCIGWGSETDATTLIHTYDAVDRLADRESVLEAAARVRCPTLVIQGTDDAVVAEPVGLALAEALGSDVLRLGGAGHLPNARQPVAFNLALRGFVERLGTEPWR